MAQQFHVVKENIQRSLRDSSKPWAPLLTQIEVKTGVDRQYVFGVSVGIIGIWLVYGYAAQLICNSVGFLYPAYTSIHAIESPSKDDDTKWLTYWVVFAIFSIIEYFADIIVGWFPLYWFIKCVFFIWLMIPTNCNGSLVIYRNIIRPYFILHHNVIDSTLDNLRENASKLIEQKSK